MLLAGGTFTDQTVAGVGMVASNVELPCIGEVLFSDTRLLYMSLGGVRVPGTRRDAQEFPTKPTLSQLQASLVTGTHLTSPVPGVSTRMPSSVETHHTQTDVEDSALVVSK